MKHNQKKHGITIAAICTILLGTLLLVALVIPTFAQEDSPYPPPAGKAWIKSGGKWVMIPAPPNEGPYRWTGNDWARIENIPPERKWIPPHWDYDSDKWIMGHWKIMRSDDETQYWASGHWADNGQWIEGEWKTGERRSSGINNDTWIPGVNVPRPPIRPRPPGTRPPTMRPPGTRPPRPPVRPPVRPRPK